MRVNSKTREVATIDDVDVGEGLAVFFSQNGNSVARYRFLVKARTDQGGFFDVGEFFSSPPLATNPPGRLTRMIAGAVCPGVVGWAVEVSCVGTLDPESEDLVIPADDTAEVLLISSKCCTSPIGVTRVGERYKYIAQSAAGGTQTFVSLAGMRITGIAAVGLSGGGTVDIAGGGNILVPEGISVNLAPGASLTPNSIITFGNVDWVIEYLESA